MTKREYFDHLHEKLGKELGISSRAVETIRSFALGPRKLTRGQIILFTKERLKKFDIQRTIGKVKEHDCSFCKHIKEITEVIPSRKKDMYLEILNFVGKAGERIWKDITFDYKYSSEPGKDI